MRLFRNSLIPLTMLILPACASPKLMNTAAEAPDLTNGPILSAAIKDGSDGLSQDDPLLRERLQDEAKEFIRFRRMSPKSPKRKDALEECQADDLPSPFCRLLDKEKRAERLIRKSIARGSVKKIAHDLRSGRIEHLAEASEAEIFLAVKSVTKFSTLQKTLEASLKSESCSGPLLTALGLRSEEEFPSPEAKAQTKGLYGKAMGCGHSMSLVRSAYRLAMIQLWEGELDQAEGNLARITLPDGVEYRSRVLYWRWYIASKKGNIQLQKELRSALLREFPLSLHALMLGSLGGKLQEQPILSQKDPRILLRSKTAPEFNLTVAAVETLQSMQEPLLSAELLTPLADRMKNAEPEFRLYVTVLMMRSGDFIGKLQTLIGLLREKPEYITRPTLEMLYPVNRLDIARTHETKLDPYFVLALIRQESAFNAKARSRAGAIGLMQLMPSTARTLERVSKNQLYNPETNVRLGVKYFSRLLEKYDGDVELALAAYNAGADRVASWVRRYPTDNRLLFLDIMPYRETRDYVASITRNYFWYLRLYERDPSMSFSLLKSAFVRSPGSS